MVGSRLSSVWSRLELKALAASVGGTLGHGYCLVAARNGHAGGCRASDLGCSRRRVIVDPLPERGGMSGPWRVLWISKLFGVD